MAWELKPGVQQDARGRLYRVAVNSRGRQDKIYYQETGAERARMIPVPIEQPKQRKVLKVKDNGNAKRRMRVEFRVKGQTEVRVLEDTKEVAEAFVTQHRAVCALRQNEETGAMEPVVDFFGNPMRYLHLGSWDWFNLLHVDVEEGS